MTAGKGKAATKVRCAIYTRKSTEEGLEQEYNSLDAQRDSAEAYIKSQAAEGWTLLPTRYDDGGFSGINKDGWDYLWFQFEDKEDANAEKVVRRPRAAYVEQIYKRGNFAGLGI